MFLLSEGEWARIFLESGPVLGLAYVLWRCGLMVYVGLALSAIGQDEAMSCHFCF